MSERFVGIGSGLLTTFLTGVSLGAAVYIDANNTESRAAQCVRDTADQVGRPIVYRDMTTQCQQVAHFLLPSPEHNEPNERGTVGMDDKAYIVSIPEDLTTKAAYDANIERGLGIVLVPIIAIGAGAWVGGNKAGAFSDPTP